MTANNVRQVRLTWAGEGLVFHGGPDGGPRIVVDSGAREGLAPMQLLLTSVAGCMAVDVLMILEKSRVPVDALEVEAIGIRADETPRRYVSVDLVYRVGGPGPEHQSRLDRAIELSRGKYCSVLHTLDPKLAIDIRAEVG